jgi:hypothetical protein
MLYELAFPKKPGSIDPDVFEVAKKSLANSGKGALFLREGELIGHPIRPFFDPLLESISTELDRPFQLTRVEAWKRTAEPGKPFMTGTTRNWHFDDNTEFLIADTQGPEFLGGPFDAELVAGNMNMSNIMGTFMDMSDEQLLAGGLLIDQLLDNVAGFNTRETLHRTSINRMPYPVTRHLLIGICEITPLRSGQAVATNPQT